MAKNWGYEFGVDGVLQYAKAAELLDVSIDTIERYAAAGHIRTGTHKGRDRRGHRVICRRSLTLYLKSIEQGAGQ